MTAFSLNDLCLAITDPQRFYFEQSLGYRKPHVIDWSKHTDWYSQSVSARLQLKQMISASGKLVELSRSRQNADSNALDQADQSLRERYFEYASCVIAESLRVRGWYEQLEVEQYPLSDMYTQVLLAHPTHGDIEISGRLYQVSDKGSLRYATRYSFPAYVQLYIQSLIHLYQRNISQPYRAGIMIATAKGDETGPSTTNRYLAKIEPLEMLETLGNDYVSKQLEAIIDRAVRGQKSPLPTLASCIEHQFPPVDKKAQCPQWFWDQFAIAESVPVLEAPAHDVKVDAELGMTLFQALKRVAT